ncbi:MAG: hypothetical protein ACHWZW_09545 [Spirulina sp.]
MTGTSVERQDRLGIPVQPKEWFCVPLGAIEEAIDKIQSGHLHQFYYDPKTASLQPISERPRVSPTDANRR